MVYQDKLRSPAPTPAFPNGVNGGVPVTVMGVPPYDTCPAKQSDVFKELVNKLSWALGSTYRLPYGHVRLLTRQVALEMAKRLIVDHGYPRSILKD